MVMLRLLLRVVVLLLLLVMCRRTRLWYAHVATVHKRAQMRLMALVIEQARARRTEPCLTRVRRKIVRVVMVAVMPVLLVVRQGLLRCRLSVTRLTEQRWTRCGGLTGPRIVRLVLLVCRWVRVVLRVLLMLRMLRRLHLCVLRVLQMLAMRRVLSRSLHSI